VGSDGEPGIPTQSYRGAALFIRRFEVTVLDGPDRGLRASSETEELSIGSSEGNELQLTDVAVSRHHCALRTSDRGLSLRDLGSRNGTFVGDAEIVRCFVQSGARFRVGRSTLGVQILDEEIERPIATVDRFGSLLGASPAMRRVYPLIEQCARSSATVLVTGETGTGKDLVAEAIHEHGDRRAGPYVVIDCSALAHDLAEAELFGHERGAFTGAEMTRIGAFEAAQGGTVFLDEIGELPLALQPLLLRALDGKTIRRVGGTEYRPIDVRVIAASHRDLRAEVNDKRFRADLFYRLNVLRIALPPLRERAGDIRMLATHFWHRLRPDRAVPEGLLEHLAAQHFRGNVRELRNTVERISLAGWSPPRTAAPHKLTYQEAKDRAIKGWEREWVEALVAEHGGNLSRAARAVRMGRSHLRELVRLHGIAIVRPADPGDDAGDTSENRDPE
jgi:transcriptional regulator with GAF, ATPase, and Fis domain